MNILSGTHVSSFLLSWPLVASSLGTNKNDSCLSLTHNWLVFQEETQSRAGSEGSRDLTSLQTPEEGCRIWAQEQLSVLSQGWA